MTHTKELLPCPFCGAMAEHDVVTQGGEANPDFGGHFIQCTNTRCHGCMGLRFACGDDPKPALFAAWNTRAGLNPDAVADVVAALEHYAKTYCEGYGECVGDLCGKFTPEECGGCKAYTALARIRGEG